MSTPQSTVGFPVGESGAAFVASFNIEDFSLNRFQQITFEDIENRIKEFEEIVRL